MREIKRIIIHCSASEFLVDAASIRRVHKLRYSVDKNGRRVRWRDIGYHWVVTRWGEVQKGRPVEEIGAHCRHDGANYDSIGICLCGLKDFDIIQLEEMRDFVCGLLIKYNLKYSDVYCHYELNPNKTCPNMTADIVRAYIKGGLNGSRTMDN